MLSICLPIDRPVKCLLLLFSLLFSCCGSGELLWSDGRRYIGQFLDGQFEGFGVYTVPKDDGTAEVSEGWWKAGQLHGYGVIRYGTRQCLYH